MLCASIQLTSRRCSGASKAAANFLVVTIHKENPEWTALALHPGLIQSDMGNAGAKAFGLEKAIVTIEDSANGMLKQIDVARRQEKAQFLDYTGEIIAW